MSRRAGAGADEGKSEASVVKPPRSKTAKYYELPHWLQDNEYILAGYRWCVLCILCSFLGSY